LVLKKGILSNKRRLIPSFFLTKKTKSRWSEE
jgi:hypothetical protein